MRKLNLVFLAILLVSVPALGGVTYFVHYIQMDRNAKTLLVMAGDAEKEGKPDKAAEYLGHYLELRKNDGETYEWYARVLDRLYAEVPQRRGMVLDVYQEALRFDPDDTQILRQCADIAMTPYLNRTNDARTHLNALLEYYKDS